MSFAQGFQLGLQLRRQLMESEERKERFAQQRQLFDLQLEEARAERSERQALPGARADVLGAVTAPPPAMAMGEVGEEGLLSGNINLADIQELAGGPAETIPQVLQRLGPEGARKLELVMRRSPQMMSSLGLLSPQEAQKRQDERKRQQQARALFTEGLADLGGGKVKQGTLKLAQVGFDMGGRVDIKAIADAMDDEDDRTNRDTEGPKLADIMARMAKGDAAAATELYGLAVNLRSKSLKAVVTPALQLANQVIAGKASPDVAAGYTSFYATLEGNGGNVARAWAGVPARSKQAMQAGRMVPAEVTAHFERESRKKDETDKPDELVSFGRGGLAWKRSGKVAREPDAAPARTGTVSRAERMAEQEGLDPGSPEYVERVLGLERDFAKTRPGGTIKDLEGQAVQIAQKTFPEDLTRQRALADRLTAMMNDPKRMAKAPTFAEIVQQIEQEIAVATGKTTPATPEVKREAFSLWQSIKDAFGAKAAPGPAAPDKGAPPTAPSAGPTKAPLRGREVVDQVVKEGMAGPPPAAQTPDAAKAEFRRLVKNYGLKPEQAVEQMKAAGWNVQLNP